MCVFIVKRILSLIRIIGEGTNIAQLNVVINGGTMKDKDIQAFPLHNTRSPISDNLGITLRDVFAGQALSSIDRNSWIEICNDSRNKNTTPYQECAEHYYKIADAMIAERNKQ